MEIDEVSLVDRGANQHAAVTIAKRAPEESDMTDLYFEDGTLLTDDNAVEGAEVFDEEGNAFTLEQDVEEGEQPDGVEKSLWAAGAGGTTKVAGNALVHAPNQGKAFKAGNAARRGLARGQRGAAAVGGNRGVQMGAAGATGAAGGAGAERKFGKSFSEQVMEDISKAYSDDERDQIIAKALQDMEAQQSEAFQIAKSEKDLRLTREYIEKADSYGLPVSGDELGPVLYRMTESMSFEDCSVIAKALETAGEVAGQFFEEIGKSGGGANSDVMEMVNGHADAFLSENQGQVDVSKAEAVGGIFDMNPAAYDEYLAEQRANLRG